VIADEARLLEVDGDADPFERLRALSGLVVDDVASSSSNGLEVDLDRWDPDAEASGVPGEVRDLRAAQHDLGRNAAVEVALAAKRVPLSQGHPQVRSASELERHLRSRRSAADHEGVEPFHHEPPRNPMNTRA